MAEVDARLSCVAAHTTHAETGEKELHGSAGKQSGRSEVRYSMLVMVADTDRVLVPSPEYRLAVSCRVKRRVPSASILVLNLCHM